MAELETITGAFPTVIDVANHRSAPVDLPERILPQYSLDEMMPLAELQDKLSDYIRDVLNWQFRSEKWYVAVDLLIRHPAVRTTRNLAPDVALFVGVVRPDSPAEPLQSWEIYPPEFPPPTVVFEIASNSTWRKDLHEKAPIYAAMGISEYYAYDPRPERLRAPQERGKPRLRGWMNAEGTPEQMQPDEHGRIYSPVLESYLTPDHHYLRFRDASGALRPTGEEAERVAKERALVGEAAQRAARERAVAQNERLMAKLRELGIVMELSDTDEK